jgi:hypothetical protein
MAKGPRPDDILEFVVAWSAANYVAKLRVTVLRTEGLKRLGHIFDFATLSKRMHSSAIWCGLPFNSGGRTPLVRHL